MCVKRIILEKVGDDLIHVESNYDIVGMDIRVPKVDDESAQCMIALAEFLGYDPQDILNFDLTMEDDYGDIKAFNDLD